MGHYKLFIQTTEECNALDWGFDTENGEKYPPNFDVDCSGKFPGCLHISTNQGNNISYYIITVLPEFLLNQSLWICSCSFVFRQITFHWNQIRSSAVTKHNAIFGKQREKWNFYISGRRRRAHADYHPRHHHQQYRKPLLSQYIQVLDRDNLLQPV